VQAGHGGAGVSNATSGTINVGAGNNVSLLNGNPNNGASVHIGHGDDVRGGAAGFGGFGDREGDITVAAGVDLIMEDGLIGHANDESPAQVLSGSTQIGVGRDPDEFVNGDIIANAESQFLGMDELRFYLYRRGNSQIASGALVNGETWSGAPDEPSLTQRPDEYTINVIGDEVYFPNEHENDFGTGPAPSNDVPGTLNAGGFAFFFDTIQIGEPIVDGQNGTGNVEVPEREGAVPPANFFGFDDRTVDDWQRDQQREFSKFNFDFEINYEGFEQYGPNGENIWDYLGRNDLTAEQEELLRRLLRSLREGSGITAVQ
ncbi:MAG: hypothetical protein AAGC68_15000, partial [Verrucomicrobiota bacterium]